VSKDVHQEHDEHFDLEWDDGHVFPDLIYPDLDFMFEKMNDVTWDTVSSGTGKRILDVGSGRCIDAVELAKRGDYCYGLEISSTMLRHSKEHMANHGAEVVLVRGIGERLPFRDDAFDTVLCKGAMDHFPDPDQAVAEMTRVTKPGGEVIIAIANFESLGFKLGKGYYNVKKFLHVAKNDGRRKAWEIPPDHIYKFDYPFLKSLLERHTEIQRATGVSLMVGAPKWGPFLHKLPRSASRAILNPLDKMARHLPRLSDCIVMTGSPRRNGGVGCQDGRTQ
jgi:SAM-dependent methyltransferase